MKSKEIVRLQTKIEKIEVAEEKLRAKLEKTKAPAAKKPAAKRTAKKADEAVEEESK